MRRMRAVFALAALACYPGILVAQSRRITVAVNVADSAHVDVDLRSHRYLLWRSWRRRILPA